MSWTIHHVNLQVNDVRESARFYNDILGIVEGTMNFRGEMQRSQATRGDRFAYLPEADESRSLHLVTPSPQFSRDSGMWINPTIGGHLAIRVSDLDSVKQRLDARGWPYYDAGEFVTGGVRNIYFYDPSMNMIEVNAQSG
jgi:catechol 2,3-dioxygenase-like lactoylglutathione lyase family enzyme